jgi:hypothetical protein
MNINKKYDHDLVTEDYYKKEIEFQKDIDKLNNSKNLVENIQWEKVEEGILLTFPKSIESKHITGNVFLYRPSNKQFDFEIQISLSNHNLLIPDKRLLDGRWNINVDWQHKGKSYLYKKEIIY